MVKLNYKLIVLDAFKGQIFSIDPNDYVTQVLIEHGEATPDGVVYNPNDQLLYWTNMGKDYDAQDGYIKHCSLNGKCSGYTVNVGDTHTPKQLAIDTNTNYLYWCDREGMKIERCHIGTGKVEVLLDTCNMFINEVKENRYCVGIALDTQNNRIFWTMKGPSKGGQGKLLCAPFDYRNSKAVIDSNEIRIIFDKLPEPIDLAIDYQNDFLYWSDRGLEPDGNSLNRVKLSMLDNKEVLIRGFNEAIGFIIDSENNIAFVSDLSGHIYQVNLISKGKKVILNSYNSGFTGLTRF
ncbi:TPA: hypothetical protein ACKP1B_003984 [Serratia fonticola]